MRILITDPKIRDSVIDLHTCSHTVDFELKSFTHYRNHINLDDLAKLKKLCQEYLEIPLIQALRTDLD